MANQADLLTKDERDRARYACEATDAIVPLLPGNIRMPCTVDLLRRALATIDHLEADAAERHREAHAAVQEIAGWRAENEILKDDLRSAADRIAVMSAHLSRLAEKSPAARRWHDGEPPRHDDGHVLLVVLRDNVASDRGGEYYGKPVAVSCWPSKLKTTYDARRLEYADVVKWAEVEPWDGKADA